MTSRRISSARARLLWIDEEPVADAVQEAFASEGIEIEVATSLADGQRRLVGGQFSLVVLDVMMPLGEEDEREGYAGDETDDGVRAGLAFFVRHRALLESRSIPTMVLTQRVDGRIHQMFIDAGLPAENFTTKLKYRMADRLIAKVKGLLGWKLEN